MSLALVAPMICDILNAGRQGGDWVFRPPGTMGETAAFPLHRNGEPSWRSLHLAPSREPSDLIRKPRTANLPAGAKTGPASILAAPATRLRVENRMSHWRGRQWCPVVPSHPVGRDRSRLVAEEPRQALVGQPAAAPKARPRRRRVVGCARPRRAEATAPTRRARTGTRFKASGSQSTRNTRSSRWIMAARPVTPSTPSISRELRPASRAAWSAS